MYLLALNNTDYICITLFFALIALIAYLSRSGNNTAATFLFTKTKVDNFLFYWGGFGIVEIALAAIVASKYGVSIFYMSIIVGFIVIFLLADILKRKYRAEGVTNFNDFVSTQLGATTANTVAGITLITFMAIAVIAEQITFELLHALFGWNFVNSIIGVMALILISLIIGGIKGLKYNSFIQTLWIFIIEISVFILVAIKTNINTIITNLTNLAISNNHLANYYTGIHLTTNNISILLLFILGFAGFYIINNPLNWINQIESFDNLSYSNSLSFITKVIVMLGLFSLGILAIGLKTPHKTLADGKDIVTIQATLPDGQTGYIVKAIDSNSLQSHQQPGLIPPLIDPTTGISDVQQYNYDVASVVTLSHYIPRSLTFLLMFFVMAAFILAFSSYIINAARIILYNIILPNKIFSQFGEAREIWVLRVSILAVSFIVTAISEIYLPHFIFISAMYYLVTVLLVPIFAITMLCMISNGRLAYITILLGILVALSLNFMLSMPNLLHKSTLIALITFLVIFIGGLILNGIEKSPDEAI